MVLWMLTSKMWKRKHDNRTFFNEKSELELLTTWSKDKLRFRAYFLKWSLENVQPNFSPNHVPRAVVLLPEETLPKENSNVLGDMFLKENLRA